MTKRKQDNAKKHAFRSHRSLPILSRLKPGLHMVGKSPNEIIFIVRKVHFPAPALPTGHSPCKYFNQRYSLFTKFDEGVELDNESWYSVTHEIIAEHIAKICRKCSVVMDGFSGVGGNVIQFAKYCKVLAVDIDSNKLKMLKKNTEIYGVQMQVEMVNADFLEVYKSFGKVDVLFASPPWGGPEYLLENEFDTEKMTPDLGEILAAAAEISENVIVYLPKTLNPLSIYSILQKTQSKFKKVEFQILYIGKNVKGVACLFGDLVHPDPIDLKSLYT